MNKLSAAMFPTIRRKKIFILRTKIKKINPAFGQSVFKLETDFIF